jgi:hypothetical protein
MKNIRRNIKKIRIGDIFEIHVSNGYAYGQAIFYHKIPPRYGWFVRVFLGIQKTPEQDIKKICQKPTQFVSFFLLDHYIKSKEAIIIGNASVPSEDQTLPPIFKKFFIMNKSWYLSRIDGGKFSNGANSEFIGKVLPDNYRNLPYGNVLYYEQLAKRIEIGWTSLDDPPSGDFEFKNARQNENVMIEENRSKILFCPTATKLPADSPTPNPLKEILLTLLDKLDTITDNHKEIYDTVVRELMNKAIWEGFILPQKGFHLPRYFGTNSRSCDREIRVILQDFLNNASKIVHEYSILDDSQVRLFAFQDSRIRSKKNNAYDDFFGHLGGECICLENLSDHKK